MGPTAELVPELEGFFASGVYPQLQAAAVWGYARFRNVVSLCFGLQVFDLAVGKSHLGTGLTGFGVQLGYSLYLHFHEYR